MERDKYKWKKDKNCIKIYQNQRKINESIINMTNTNKIYLCTSNYKLRFVFILTDQLLYEALYIYNTKLGGNQWNFIYEQIVISVDGSTLFH